MKLDVLSRLMPESVPGAPEWLPQLLAPLNQFMEQVTLALRGRLTASDNFLTKLVEIKFSHGVEREILAPDWPVIGVVGLYAEGQAIAGVELAHKASGKKGLTVYFASGAGTDVFCRLRLEG